MGQFGAMSKGAVAIMAGFALSGCMGAESEGGVTRLLTKAPEVPQTAREKEAASSAIISDLQTRYSALPEGGTFDQVATQVLAAYSRAAEADLRAARLRARAASKNWLPRIGPSISLTSLADVIANLVVEQVLYDHGRKKAEREFAKADVEVAAVNLAMDTNERVYTALTLYLDAAQARERVSVEQQVLKDMSHFEWVMSERVKGGVSDMSDLNILRAKLAEIRATIATQQEAAATAMAELNAMSAQKLDGLRGLSDLRVGIEEARPLAVLRAEAEKDRDIAGARIARADQLPGLTANGTIGTSSDMSVNVSSSQLLGLGTGDTLKAIEAEKLAADRRVAQAAEDANRDLRRLEQRLAALSRQVGEAAGLTANAKANLDLFQRQYDAGQRQVMDVVGVYETFAARLAQEVGLKYDLARTRLEIARDQGLLVEGSRI